MYDVANIRCIDAHAKGYCCNDHPQNTVRGGETRQYSILVMIMGRICIQVTSDFSINKEKIVTS